ncbi:MAG: hypothetical protein GY696_10225 [Gammaproteobacteria bacterium]|nr:hypothetical protein [Gammaproteobacteria bacterium]
MKHLPDFDGHLRHDLLEQGWHVGSDLQLQSAGDLREIRGRTQVSAEALAAALQAVQVDLLGQGVSKDLPCHLHEKFVDDLTFFYR